jgi:hypothetical protein
MNHVPFDMARRKRFVGKQVSVLWRAGLCPKSFGFR